MKPSNSADFTWRTDLVVTGVVLVLGAGGAVPLQKLSGCSMNPVVVVVMAFAVALAAALGACYIALVAAASGLLRTPRVTSTTEVSSTVSTLR